MKYSEQKELVDGLRAMADFFEKHIELPAPYRIEASQYVSVYDPDTGAVNDMATHRKMVSIARSLGSCKKVYNTYSMQLVREFSKKVKLSYQANREAVCKKVVKEVKKVPKMQYTEVPGEFEDEEVVEWVCDPLLS